jgi:hypothetical protein
VARITNKQGERMAKDLDRFARQDPSDRGCGKAIYSTKGRARQAAEKMRAIDRKRGNPRPVEIYRCRTCHEFHIGHGRA